MQSQSTGKVKEHVKTHIHIHTHARTHTVTKTFLHATMHLKFLKTVFINSHAYSSNFSAMALSFNTFRRTEPCKEEQLLIKMVIQYLFCNAKVTN